MDDFLELGNLPSSITLKLRGNLELRGAVRSNRASVLVDPVVFDEALSITANDLDKAIRDAMSRSEWDLRNGSSGDIIDTGTLRDGMEVSIGGNGVINIVNDVPYAALVHYGGYIVPYGSQRAKRVYLPARPWVRAVLDGFGGYDIAIIYRNALRNLLNGL